MNENSDNTPNDQSQLVQSILDSSSHGIMSFKSIRDENGAIIDFKLTLVNQLACEMAKMDQVQLLNETLSDLMADNISTGLFEQYCHVVNTGERIKIEQYYKNENLNGWFEICAVKCNDGFTVSFQDISPLKKTVFEAEKKEERYRKLFEESIDAIFVVNEELDILDTNHALQTLSQYEMGELTRMSLSQILEDQGDIRKLKKILESDHVEEFETEVISKDGELRSVLMNIVAIRGDKEQTYYLGLMHDITERIKAERQMVQAEKLAMTGKIARTIAHEVRNPLTNVSLALEQLKDEVPEELDDVELYFSIIDRNTTRISKLITDLLNSSKPKELRLERTSLNEEIEKACTLILDRIHLQNMELIKEFEENLPFLSLDKDQLQIALLNLLINAVEAMKANKGVLKLKTWQKNNHIFLEIRDNGRGISKDGMGRLFEPFFTSKSDGTGLGLTTAQNIISSHKGMITAKSKVGEGTAFTLKFPQ